MKLLKGNRNLAISTIEQECIKIIRNAYSGHHVTNFSSPMYDKLNSEITAISNKISTAIVNCEFNLIDDSQPVSGILNRKTASDTSNMYISEFFERISPGSIGKKRTSYFNTQFKYSLDKIAKQWKDSNKKRGNKC